MDENKKILLPQFKNEFKLKPKQEKLLRLANSGLSLNKIKEQMGWSSRKVRQEVKVVRRQYLRRQRGN